MSSFKVQFKPAVQKDFRSIPQRTLLRILESIEGLTTNPFPVQSIKLAGSDRLYRIRVGDYRIIYEVETEAREIMVHYVRHRREVYRPL